MAHSAAAISGNCCSGSKHGHAALRIQAPTPPATPDDVPLSALDADAGTVHDAAHEHAHTHEHTRKKQRKRRSTKQRVYDEEDEEDEEQEENEDEDDGEQVLPLNSSAHIHNQRELALSLDPENELACLYPGCNFVASPPCLVRRAHARARVRV